MQREESGHQDLARGPSGSARAAHSRIASTKLRVPCPLATPAAGVWSFGNWSGHAQPLPSIPISATKTVFHPAAIGVSHGEQISRHEFKLPQFRAIPSEKTCGHGFTMPPNSGLTVPKYPVVIRLWELRATKFSLSNFLLTSSG